MPPPSHIAEDMLRSPLRPAAKNIRLDSEEFLDSGLSKQCQRQASYPAQASTEALLLSSVPHAHRDSTMSRCHHCFRIRHKPLSLRGCDPVSGISQT